MKTVMSVYAIFVISPLKGDINVKANEPISSYRKYQEIPMMERKKYRIQMWTMNQLGLKC